MLADGTAKRRFDPLKTVFLLVAIGINIALLARLGWGPQSISAYRALEAQAEALEKRIADKDAENLALSQEIRYLKNNGRVMEQAIRERLNYVKPNEILYVFSREQSQTGNAK